MLIKRPRGWEMPEREATPESVWRDRRRILKGMGMALPLLAGAMPLTACGQETGAADGADPTAGLYPVRRNDTFSLDRPLTEEAEATTYNNFYEFGSQKNIWRQAQKLPLRPWTVTFDGLVETPRTVDFDTLIRAMPLEERLYRFRCVEAWAMAVPWSGFPLKALVDYARPLSSARYVAMTTFGPDTVVAPGFLQRWYPWPYQEALTIEEATNDLAFIATGLYGKPIPKQNGAPLRLVVPWKYGFKNVKSLVRFHFTDKRPDTYWKTINDQEYGFWANVNPDVPHARWSQAQERMLGTGEVIPTRIYNGYGEYVADLYKGLENEPLYM